MGTGIPLTSKLTNRFLPVVLVAEENSIRRPGNGFFDGTEQED